MAESLEHQWLSNEFIRILKTFSTLDLYGYTETDRKLNSDAGQLHALIIQSLIA